MNGHTWSRYVENPGHPTAQRTYIKSDGQVVYNENDPYENRWEIEFALPGLVQSVDITYYWIVDSTAPDKHTVGIGYYDNTGSRKTLVESCDGKEGTANIPIIVVPEKVFNFGQKYCFERNIC